MKIALIGYGKMGHIIEEVAIERGHKIVARIDKDNAEDLDGEAFKSADVAIEFSTPATAEANVRHALKNGVPVVCGSTGWKADVLRSDRGPGFIWSSNYSLGVNMLFAMNKRLTEIMKPYGQYTPSIVEVHHIHKLDAPSGTAKTLGEQIETICGRKPEIESVREGEVPGIHTITWDSDVDTITLSHSAKSRKGFALGAVIAAEWLQGKEGWHTLNEVLGL